MQLCSTLLLVLCVGFAGAAGAAELKVGDPAPEFTLKGSDGKTYSLKDFKDKQAVVIAWYPKAFTGGCTKECKSFRADGAEMRKYNVAYFTASCDDVEKNTAFAKSLELDYPILSDPTRETAIAYGVASKPGEFAKRVTFYIGKDGKILFIDKKINTENAGKDVAKKLKELGVDEKKS